MKYYKIKHINGEKMTDKDIEEFTSAAHKGDIEKIKEFVKNRIDVNANNPRQVGNTALIEASKGGHLEVVEYLVDNGADVNVESEHGWTALLVASLDGHIEVIKYLVEKGADINHQERVYYNTALQLASQMGRIEIVEYLIRNGADTSKMTIVDYVNCGWFLKVKEAIESGENPNQRIQRPYDDGRGTIEESNTLLINASLFGHVEIVKYLLECGADVNLKGFTFEGNRTALEWAIQRKHTEIIKLLQNAGATK